MFRAATRSLVAPVARRTALAPAALAPVRFAPSLLVQQRTYAASALAPETIKARIEDVLKSFEKVDASKVRPVVLALDPGGFAPAHPRHLSPPSRRTSPAGAQHAAEA